MFRFGVMGLFVVMGALEGCQIDAPTEPTSSTTQSVSSDLCRGQVPTPTDWDGSTLQPGTPTTPYVYFPVVSNQHAAADHAAPRYLFARVDMGTAEIDQALFVKNDRVQLPAVLAQLAGGVFVPDDPPDPCVREMFGGVVVPGGDPGGPCVRQSELCKQAIVDLAVQGE